MYVYCCFAQLVCSTIGTHVKKNMTVICPHSCPCPCLHTRSRNPKFSPCLCPYGRLWSLGCPQSEDKAIPVQVQVQQRNKMDRQKESGDKKSIKITENSVLDYELNVYCIYKIGSCREGEMNVLELCLRHVG